MTDHGVHKKVLTMSVKSKNRNDSLNYYVAIFEFEERVWLRLSNVPFFLFCRNYGCMSTKSFSCIYTDS